LESRYLWFSPSGAEMNNILASGVREMCWHVIMDQPTMCVIPRRIDPEILSCDCVSTLTNPDIHSCRGAKKTGWELVVDTNNDAALSTPAESVSRSTNGISDRILPFEVSEARAFCPGSGLTTKQKIALKGPNSSPKLGRRSIVLVSPGAEPWPRRVLSHLGTIKNVSSVV